jgi:ubiquinone/menaquinone biosynthesis C-methylase UbiE
MNRDSVFWDKLYDADERTATVTLQGSCINKEKWLGDSWKSGESVLDNIKKFAGKGTVNTLLDLGCGSNGRFLIPSAAGHIISFGIDLSKSALDKIRPRIDAANARHMVFLCQADANKNLVFRNSSFDAVLCQGLVCHLKNQQELLKEVCRILKPRGVVFFGSFLNKWHPAHYIYYFVNKLKSKIGITVTPYYYNTLEGVKNMFESAGFKIIRVDKIMSLCFFYDTIPYPYRISRFLDKAAGYLFRLPFKYEVYARKQETG